MSHFIMYLSWVLLAGSTVGAFLNNNKKRSGFVVWFFANMGWVVVNVHMGIYAGAIAAAIFAVMNIHGFISWRTK